MSVDISKIDAVELDALIARAAQRRAELQPEIPKDAPKMAYGVPDPAWQAYLDGEMTVLRFRHPGLGWVTFGIPPNERAHLLSLLLNHALIKQQPPPSPPSSAAPQENQASA